MGDGRSYMPRAVTGPIPKLKRRKAKRMAYEKREGSGALFKNDRKEKDTHPDYKGDILINGQEYWLSAWIKDGVRGKFMSISCQPKEQRQEPAPQQGGSGLPPGGDLDDEIPFAPMKD